MNYKPGLFVRDLWASAGCQLATKAGDLKSGRAPVFYFVGTVPIALKWLKIDQHGKEHYPTKEQAQTAVQYGAHHAGLVARTWTTAKDALNAAHSMGQKIANADKYK